MKKRMEEVFSFLAAKPLAHWHAQEGDREEKTLHLKWDRLRSLVLLPRMPRIFQLQLELLKLSNPPAREAILYQSIQYLQRVACRSGGSPQKIACPKPPPDIDLPVLRHRVLSGVLGKGKKQHCDANSNIFVLHEESQWLFERK